jgi:hypothetical protein
MKISTVLMRRPSIIEREYPAMSPAPTPRMYVTSVATTPNKSVVNPPFNVRLNTSRPKKSRPRGYEPLDA